MINLGATRKKVDFCAALNSAWAGWIDNMLESVMHFDIGTVENKDKKSNFLAIPGEYTILWDYHHDDSTSTC